MGDCGVRGTTQQSLDAPTHTGKEGSSRRRNGINQPTNQAHAQGEGTRGPAHEVQRGSALAPTETGCGHGRARVWTGRERTTTARHLPKTGAYTNPWNQSMDARTTDTRSSDNTTGKHHNTAGPHDCTGTPQPRRHPKVGAYHNTRIHRGRPQRTTQRETHGHNRTQEAPECKGEGGGTPPVGYGPGLWVKQGHRGQAALHALHGNRVLQARVPHNGQAAHPGTCLQGQVWPGRGELGQQAMDGDQPLRHCVRPGRHHALEHARVCEQDCRPKGAVQGGPGQGGASPALRSGDGGRRTMGEMVVITTWGARVRRRETGWGCDGSGGSGGREGWDNGVRSTSPFARAPTPCPCLGSRAGLLGAGRGGKGMS